MKSLLFILLLTSPFKAIEVYCEGYWELADKNSMGREGRKTMKYFYDRIGQYQGYLISEITDFQHDSINYADDDGLPEEERLLKDKITESKLKSPKLSRVLSDGPPKKKEKVEFKGGKKKKDKIDDDYIPEKLKLNKYISEDKEDSKNIYEVMVYCRLNSGSMQQLSTFNLKCPSTNKQFSFILQNNLPALPDEEFASLFEIDVGQIRLDEKFTSFQYLSYKINEDKCSLTFKKSEGRFGVLVMVLLVFFKYVAG